MQDSVSGKICFQAMKRLSLKLEGMLLSENVERISSNGFNSFSVDLKSCESKSLK